MKHDPLELSLLVSDEEGYPLPKGSPLAHDVPLRQWKPAGLAALRALAKALSLPKGSFSVRYEPGGNEIPGEHVLHGEHLYIVWGCFGPGAFGYYRTCNGVKDYVGGLNHTIPPTFDAIVTECQRLLQQIGVSHV